MLKKWKLWYWLIIALVVRLYKLSQVYCIASDGVAYIEAAKNILKGIYFNIIWPPIYPTLISFLMYLGLEPELSGSLVSIVFGVATVAFVYVFTKSVASEYIARIATIFAAVHPFFIRYSVEVLSESVFMFLLILIIWLGWMGIKKDSLSSTFLRGIKRNRKVLDLLPACGVGIASGLIYLTKPEGMGLIVIVSLWWLFSKSVGSIWKRLGLVSLSYLTFIIVISPYLFFIQQETGQWMISQKQTLVFSIALREGGYTEGLLNVSPAQYIVAHPVIFFTKFGKDLLTLLGRFPDAYHPFLFICFIAVFIPMSKKISRDESVWIWDKKTKKAFLFVMSFMLPFCIGYAVYHPGRRYLVSWVPVLLFLSAGGWQKIQIYIKHKTRVYIPTICLLIVFIPSILGPVHEHSGVWKESGVWIKENLSPGLRIRAEDERVAFYAEANNILLSKEIDYIVSKKPLEGMKLIHTTLGGANIYKVSQ